GRIRERNAAAECSTVTDRDMGDMRHGLGNQRQAFRYYRGIHDLDVSDQCPDAHAPVAARYAFERLDAIDVDQKLGLRQPHVEHRHETLATSEDARLVAMLRQQVQHLIKAPRPHIAESWSLHAKLSPLVLSGDALGLSGPRHCVTKQRGIQWR